AALDADGVCADCHSRLTDLERRPAHLGILLVDAGRLAVRIALPVAVFTVGHVLVAMVAYRFDLYVPILAYWAVQFFLLGALLHFASRAVAEKRADLMESLAAVAPRAIPLAIVGVLSALQVGFLLFAPPILWVIGIAIVPTEWMAAMIFVALAAGFGLAWWRAGRLALALPIALLEDRDTSLHALGASGRRMRKHPGAAAVFGLVSLGYFIVPLALRLAIFLAQAVVGIAGELLANVAERPPWLPPIETIQSTAALLGSPLFELVPVTVGWLAVVGMTLLSATLYAKTAPIRIY
ncbi:MAG: hypothetical protein AB7P00_38985, partial [Sandaracinaceae bacterium]